MGSLLPSSRQVSVKLVALETCIVMSLCCFPLTILTGEGVHSVCMEVSVGKKLKRLGLLVACRSTAK